MLLHPTTPSPRHVHSTTTHRIVDIQRLWGILKKSRLVCSVSEQRANESLNVTLLLKVHHFSSQVDEGGSVHAV